MSTEYPDILGDLADARQRFEANGVHYVLKIEPNIIAPGETANLHVWLQSCWDMPAQTSIVIRPPARAAPGLSVIQERTDVPLQPAEVGEVIIPVLSDAGMEPGIYALPVTVGTSLETRGLYVRSQENEGQLGSTPLSFSHGMGLSETIGLGFTARTQPDHNLPVDLAGPAQPGPAPGKARQYVNDQRLFLLPKMNQGALYMGFLAESQARFKAASLPLHIGEAIYAAKILTYAVQTFMVQTDWQDLILVPAYRLAFRHNLPTGDPVMLVVRADYARMVRMACSLTFGLLNRRLKRDIWSLEEQLAVTDLIAGRLEHGGAVPAEFLYLPLMLGGLMVSSQVTMPGEDAAQSLSIFAKARQLRGAEFDENPDLVQVLDSLQKAVQRGS